jgi:NitT/TauT family transport system ATP-binding protein
VNSQRVLVDNVSHFFAGVSTADQRPVLDQISFGVEDGEFVALVGKSGCGKTTLLNMVAGFINPSEGNVLVNGLPPATGQTAYMFARDNLLPWRRAAANVALAIELGRNRRAGARAERRQRAVELLDLVGLAGYEDHYPRQLSQGMRQRVALARTLAVESDVWLMDEPFAALDASLRTVMQAEFLRVWEATGKTVIFVTHDLIEAIVLADRVITMSPSPGRVKAVHKIELPRPRRVMELHESPEFLELYRELWRELRDDLDSAEEVA